MSGGLWTRQEFLLAAGGVLRSRKDAGFAGYRDRAIGCWLGAAIGDAMGGPVEVQHYKRIEKYFGDFQDLLPYRKPPGLINIGPGYAKHAEAGSITDDTYIRVDLARYLVAEKPPFHPKQFADWLLKNADFTNWWTQAVKVLKRIEAGELSPEKAGWEHIQGGGGGWWQPVALLHAGDPKGAYETAAGLCRIWKAPFEQNILGAVVAGQAEAMRVGASVDSVVDTVLRHCAPMPRGLFERAVEVARKAETPKALFERLYGCCLVDKSPLVKEAPMPDRVAPEEYSEKAYSSISFAEQQPWALAYLVFGQGDAARTVLTAVKGGRDADSIATNTASWLGALGGESIWPKKWRDAVVEANRADFDLREMCERLLDTGSRNGTVRP